MRKVFISHASADDMFVAELRRRLEAQGVPVWVDSRNLRGGDELAPEIEQVITEAAHVVVVISPATVNSEWVSREVEKALEVQRSRPGYRVIPVLLSGITTKGPAVVVPRRSRSRSRSDEGPLGLIVAMPKLLAALGVRERPTTSRSTRPRPRRWRSWSCGCSTRGSTSRRGRAAPPPWPGWSTTLPMGAQRVESGAVRVHRAAGGRSRRRT